MNCRGFRFCLTFGLLYDIIGLSYICKYKRECENTLLGAQPLKGGKALWCYRNNPFALASRAGYFLLENMSTM